MSLKKTIFEEIDSVLEAASSLVRNSKNVTTTHSEEAKDAAIFTNKAIMESINRIFSVVNPAKRLKGAKKDEIDFGTLRKINHAVFMRCDDFIKNVSSQQKGFEDSHNPQNNSQSTRTLLDIHDLKIKQIKNVESVTIPKKSTNDLEKKVEEAFNEPQKNIIINSPRPSHKNEIYEKIKMMEKPQMAFKNKLENDDTPYVPIVPEKNTTTLQDLERREEAIRASSKLSKHINENHPYLVEILTHSPSIDEILSLLPEASEWAKIFDQNYIRDCLKHIPLIYVDNSPALNKMIKDLDGQKLISYDLEAHNIRSYLGFTCLIQISTTQCDYIIDAIKLHDQLGILNKIFTNKDILKLGHSTSHDNIWLQRDFNVFVVNLFDTQVAGETINGFCGGMGLNNVANKYLNIKLDKKYQMADWRQRPLPQCMIEYARMDSRCLIYIFYQMVADLSEPKNHPTLDNIINNSKAFCLKMYQKPLLDSTLMLRKFGWKFDCEIQKLCSKELIIWRENLARQLDENPSLIVTNNTIYMLCKYLNEPFEKNVETYHDKSHPSLRRHIYSCKEIYESFRNKLIVWENQKNEENLAWEFGPTNLTIPKINSNNISPVTIKKEKSTSPYKFNDRPGMKEQNGKVRKLRYVEFSDSSDYDNY